ncbi:MAG: hypothetical protein WCQ41_01050 [Bacillota bacterium]
MAIQQALNRMFNKACDKMNEQLMYAKDPCILFLLKPEGIAIDTNQIRWAIEKILSQKDGFSKMSAIIIFESLNFNRCSIGINQNCDYPLEQQEVEYLLKFCDTVIRYNEVEKE